MDYQEEADNNEEKFLTFLKTADSDLFNIKIRAIEGHFNLRLLWYIMQSLLSICEDTKWGTLHIDVADGEVRGIQGEHTVKIKEKIQLE